MAPDPFLSERFEMRATEAWLAAVDDWRRTQPDLPSRGEAIRRLVEQALSHSQPRPAGAHKGAFKAKELAGREVDRASDPSATDEQRQRRKRRILKGPAEFREVRKDLPKRPG